ncbi:hypothetical protein [Flavobacterium hibernum]|uniref:Uncharacterized protein n=1 Tax=Flavobacterium hibernum TaxID=37752 RepID=A0A0D0ERY7_9FLAO|nr:hypothetical protein [Flavobacterium hibernum]KIO50958.1 hypothetical protein IW18_20455 [Flavobacterium hibernum]OXA85202.1 hypothetical protein B0A73_17795 [Flavobacterium hibernum]STO11346.1 Uncharacterised protein [Flavobacterium hibernum]
MSLIERERLFINEVEIELATDESAFARTLQVNDLVNIENRQTNFTKNIKVPKTPKNIQTFDWLGVSGNVSQFPYQKNTAKYLIGNEFLIYDGWALVNQTDGFYNISIYDGAIDLYKAIENITLANLSIDEIDHTKNIENVIASFGDDLQYKYIVADYNGQSQYSSNGGTMNDTVNIDYLVPSTKIGYLLDKTFEYANATYDGSIFDTDDFKNTYISYLRKNDGTEVNQVIYNGSGEHYSYGGAIQPNIVSVKHNVTSGVTGGGSFDADTIGFTVDSSGIYEVSYFWSIFADVDSGSYFYQNQRLLPKVLVNDTFYYPLSFSDSETSGSTQVPMNAGDTLKIVATTTLGNIVYPLRFGISDWLIPIPLWFHLQYKFVSTSSETSRKALGEFKVKEFLNEILWKYGLTMYKDKYRNHYTFKNLSEIINENNTIDWSDKFQSVSSESYLYGTYAQSNQLALKYNSDNVNYDDGYITVNNKNLNDSKVVIQSKVYAKEEDKTSNLGYESNLYKYWDKEINDEGEVNYKSLSSRFYWMTYTNKNYPAGKWFGSQSQATRAKAYVVPEESTTNQSFNYTVSKYYSEFNKILDNAKIVTANVWLTYLDVIDFDFSKLYFIKQLGAYFLVNKIINFQLNKSTSVELIQIDNPLSSTGVQPPAPLNATAVTPYQDSSGFYLTYEILIEDGYTQLELEATFMRINGTMTTIENITNVGNLYKFRTGRVATTATGGGILLDATRFNFFNVYNKIMSSGAVLYFSPSQVSSNAPKEILLESIYE